MKKVMLVVAMLMSFGSVQAFPVVAVSALISAAGTGYVVGRADAVPEDPRRNQYVTAAWADNPNGYNFEESVYAIDHSNGKIVQVK